MISESRREICCGPRRYIYMREAIQVLKFRGLVDSMLRKRLLNVFEIVLVKIQEDNKERKNRSIKDLSSSVFGKKKKREENMCRCVNEKNNAEAKRTYIVVSVGYCRSQPRSGRAIQVGYESRLNTIEREPPVSCRS